MYKDIIKYLDGVAEFSTDKRKVGCILKRVDTNDMFIGYNQPPKNDLPMRDENGITYDYVIHAELSAMLKADLSHKYDLFVSYAPCIRCASMIIYSGAINRVFYKDIIPKHKAGIELLKKYKIKCIKLQ